MIVITGATGRLGSAVVENLLRLVSPNEVVAGARDMAKARDLFGTRVALRKADYDRPDSLARAFAGAKKLLLISASGIDYERRVTQHRRAIAAAVEAKVTHIFYTSLARGEDSVAYVMKAHRDTERLIRESGLTYTILQNGVYTEAFKLYLGDYTSGEVVIPADGPVAWTSRADLAGGIARLLCGDGCEGQTLRLTGLQSLTIREFTQELGRATGKRIETRIVAVEEFVHRQVAAGKDEEHAREWATTYFAIECGELGVVDATLATILERPPMTVEDVLAHEVGTPGRVRD